MPDPPRTDEGWFVLHDFRSVDWDAWRAAPDRDRDRAVAEGVDYLDRHEAAADVAAGDDHDAGEGTSATFAVLGDEADLLVLHFRPTLDHLSAAERQFERTALAEFTDRATSYVSVTEVSGYVSTDYFDEGSEETDEGLRRYIEGKLHPDVPEGEYVSFYPMSKRRGERDNWYALDFEERADLMAGHGEVGREYAGRITQVISSSVGFDDHEWGVTLFGADPTDIKDIVYEMRFDEATARYGEFGSFYVGRRFPPADLGAYLDGDPVPTGAVEAGEAAADAHPHGEGESTPHGDAGAHPHGSDSGHGDAPTHGADSGHGDAHAHGGDQHGDSVHGGGPPTGDPHGDDAADEADIRGELADLDVYAGTPHGEDVYATVLYSEADPDDLFAEVEDLRGSFDHYDTHHRTAVYEARDGSRSAVVSVWETGDAAETAAGFLADLPDVVGRADEEAESGFGTMGMFYTIKPEHRDDFLEKFDVVGDTLADIDGHLRTDLMVNHEDENDTFIASQWRSKEDAMGFFRSEEFRDTVDWGRDVLADRPRHVFLA
jgi:chlorite dismutase